MVSHSRFINFDYEGVSNIPTFSHDKADSFGNHTSMDILLGKEKAIFNHSGNKRFRAIINYNVYKYIASPTKSSKSKLVRTVHEHMKKSGFRFLKKDSSKEGWSVIKDSNAREKLSHALRDRVRELRKPTKRRRRSTENIFPTVMSMVNTQNDNKSNAQISINCEPSKDAPLLTHHSLKTPTILNVHKPTKQPVSCKPFCIDLSMGSYGVNKRRRLSLLNLVDTIPTRDEMRLGPKRRLSLLAIDGISSTEVSRKPSNTNIEQGKNSTMQQRRLSIETLFGGLAHEIADAQSEDLSRRNSIASTIQCSSHANGDAPVKFISFANIDEESAQSSDDEELSNSVRRLSMSSLVANLGQKHDDVYSSKSGRRLSLYSISFGNLSQVDDHEAQVQHLPA